MVNFSGCDTDSVNPRYLELCEQKEKNFPCATVSAVDGTHCCSYRKCPREIPIFCTHPKEEKKLQVNKVNRESSYLPHAA